MADIADTLKGLLGDGAEDTIKNVMGSLSQNDRPPINTDADSMASLMQIKRIAEGLTTSRSDPRANLLLSLKPYMRDGRKQSIDNAVKMIGMLKILQLLGKQ
ncbi:MAG: hypothetical protein IJI39_01205 [Clostridia bacterium]|nr:hypothetical protein [Clostridia bacterium]